VIERASKTETSNTLAAASVATWCNKLIPSEGDLLSNHERTFHAPATVEAIKLVPAGCKLSQVMPGYGSNYRRLVAEKPSWTVTATCYTDLIHPVEDRILTAREMARLQTFPDGWRFFGPRRGGVGKRLVAHIFAQIGNAVPPMLAFRLADHIKAQLFSTDAPLSIVSLFTGAGGMDLGFEAAGFDVRVCIEKDNFAAGTLRVNQQEGKHGQRHDYLRNAAILSEDIFEIRAKDILRAARLSGRRIDVVIGGPPCQPFSHAGTREGRSDHRGLLLDEFLRIVCDLKPNCVVFENVPGLRSADDGAALKYLSHGLSDLGLAVEMFFLNAADYGVPQIRKRLFVVAHKSSRNIGPPRATHMAISSTSVPGLFKPYRTVADAFAELPPATEPGRVAEAISKTIEERKRKQDFSKFLKRSTTLHAEAEEALQPYRRHLSRSSKMPATDYAAILLFMLTNWRQDISSREALQRFSQEFDLDLPEKAFEAIHFIGTRELAQSGYIDPAATASSRLRLLKPFKAS
jgi:DNA (cytosine-5)-methyltransferase 1